MVKLLDPRPMARIYNAERSNANCARQQQMADTSQGSQPTFESFYGFDNNYRPVNDRDTSHTDVSSRTKQKSTSVAQAPPSQQPPQPSLPPPTYNGDEQSLHKLLTAMPTASSHRHEMATRSRR